MFHAYHMQDMSKTPEEVKEDMEPTAPMDMASKYPYGLCINLDEDQLKKLDLEKPEIGDMIHLMAMATVTSVSEHQKMGGEACCRVELQITHLGLENEDEEGEEEDE